MQNDVLFKNDKVFRKFSIVSRTTVEH